MFSKILIANRGEIAVRIARACRELGIDVVAVHSTADADALHVQVADEAYEIGPPPALASYLRIDAIVDAARASGAEAVHPGYGFLAENAEFARAVEAADLVWIGPPAEVIKLMGDKVAAKGLARSAGVPTLSDYTGEDLSPDRVRSEAERIGYPVMIKAAAGGGGKGMRTVSGPEELQEALEGARREAQSAFGDDRVFLEKYLRSPRHIEMQILADRAGNSVYLGERECSLQRRHQKILEEAPSPVVTADLRRAMGRDAVRLARRAGYVNAGTVEFLFEGDSYYFLEMNARIQVEHPVTEMVTGMDLVRAQIEIAAGVPLVTNQEDVEIRGHAVEVRLYAEDPVAGFVPATGRLQAYVPPEGPGIRNDVGVFAGAEISPYYDPMLAKLISHGPTRTDALVRLKDALRRYVALGVTTNIPFLLWLCEQEEVVAGRMSTDLVERLWTPAVQSDVPIDVLIAAAGYEILTGEATATDPWRAAGGWRIAGSARRLVYEGGGRTYALDLESRGDGWAAGLDEEEREVRFGLAGESTLLVQEGARVSSFQCLRAGEDVVVQREGNVYRLRRGGLRNRRAARAPGTDGGLAAPMPGTVVKVAVQVGATVAAHEALVVLEAMKMEHVIRAPHAGTVRAIFFGEGDLVPAGSPLVSLEGPPDG